MAGLVLAMAAFAGCISADAGLQAASEPGAGGAAQATIEACEDPRPTMGSNEGGSWRVENEPDEFQFMASYQHKTGTESFRWRTTQGVVAVQFMIQGEGSATLVLRDAAGAPMYEMPFKGGSARDARDTPAGQAGCWSIDVQMSGFHGSFRVEAASEGADGSSSSPPPPPPPARPPPPPPSAPKAPKAARAMCQESVSNERDNFAYACNGRQEGTRAYTWETLRAGARVTVAFDGAGSMTLRLHDASGLASYEQTFEGTAASSEDRLLGLPGEWSLELDFEGFDGSVSVSVQGA